VIVSFTTNSEPLHMPALASCSQQNSSISERLYVHNFKLLTMSSSSKRARSAEAGPHADARDLGMNPAASSMQGSQAEGLEQQPESSSSHDRTETRQGRSTDAAPQEQGSADENQWLYKVVVTLQ
jgi:hypothetical protein